MTVESREVLAILHTYHQGRISPTKSYSFDLQFKRRALLPFRGM